MAVKKRTSAEDEAVILARSDALRQLRDYDEVVRAAMDRFRGNPKLAVDLRAVEGMRNMRVFSRRDAETNRWSRVVPAYVTVASDLNKISEAFHEVQVQREKVSDVATRVESVLHDLKRLWSELTLHLSEIPPIVFGSSTEKPKMFRFVLAELAQRIDDAEHVISCCKQKRADLDGAYFILTANKEIGMMQLGKKV